MAVKLTSGNFEKEVYEAGVPVLVDFYADWCGPCKAMGPVVEALAAQYEGKAVVGKINVDENSDIAMKYGVMSIPTFLVFKGSEVSGKAVGMRGQKDLEKMIEDAM